MKKPEERVFESLGQSVRTRDTCTYTSNDVHFVRCLLALLSGLQPQAICWLIHGMNLLLHKEMS